jgi:glycosyltransferase involved in cell wall biosynthesis
MDGGVPYMATLLLRSLAEAGVEVDCYITGSPSDLPPALVETGGLRFMLERAPWPLRRAVPIVSFIGGQSGRLAAQRRLARRLFEEHARRPYELVYQFSQIEMPALQPYRRRLPAVVVHPEVHAAGELRWHRHERELSRRCEPVWRRRTARLMLSARAASQRRGLRGAAAVIAPSARFAELLSADCGYPRDRIHVVPNPVDIERFHPSPAGPRGDGGPLRLLFVSRMAVRKGVEMVVELSRRLADLEGRARIEAVGDASLWSDYRCLLEGLDPRTARFRGAHPAADLPRLYSAADIVLQPSHYEPFALTVAEALACGTPVVASDEVGAAEFVDQRCCRVFAAGDHAAFESTVRGLLETLSGGERDQLGELARSEAQRAFHARQVGARVAEVLAAVRDRSG